MGGMNHSFLYVVCEYGLAGVVFVALRGTPTVERQGLQSQASQGSIFETAGNVQARRVWACAMFPAEL